MGSHYASSSTSHGYQPVSPPWSYSGSPPSRYHDGIPRAPAMPYAALPTLDYTPHAPMSPHYGLLTPPPTPGEMHTVLSARPTIVRYDFAHDPDTIRMSSSAPSPSFPGRECAVRPGIAVLYVECEASGKIIAIRSSSSTRNVITCSDVLTQLYHYFAQPLQRDDWQRVQDPRQRRAMKAAFARRKEHSHEQRPSMRHIDYLEGQTVFKRLIPKRGDSLRSTWTLQTTS